MYVLVIEVKEGFVQAYAALHITGIKNNNADLASITIKGVSVSPVTAITSAEAGTFNVESSDAKIGKVTLNYAQASDTSSIAAFASTLAEGATGATAEAYLQTEALTGVVDLATKVSETKLENNAQISSETGETTKWIVVKATAEDTTTTQYYVIKVTCQSQASASDNAKISAISVGGASVTLGTVKGDAENTAPEELGTANVPYAQMASAAISITTEEDVMSVEVSTADPTSSWTSGKALEKGAGNVYSGNIALTGFSNLYIKVTASNGTSVAYYKVKITEIKSQPVISVEPTRIDIGAESPTLTITITNSKDGVEFADSLDTQSAQFELTDNTTGLTVESVSGSGTTAELKLQGTATEGKLTLTVKNGAFKHAEGDAAAVTVTVAAAPTPSTPTTPSTSVDDPATEDGETTVDVNTGSTLSGTTANATVSGANMDKAVESAVTEAAKQETAPVVEVNVDTSSRADGINVTLPADSLDKLAQAEGSSLKITSDVAEVEMDNTALAALAEQADTTAVLSVTPAKNMNAAQTEAAGTAPVVDVTVTSGGKAITDYHGGILLITLPYKLPAGHDAASVMVFYLDDAGKLTACATNYKDGKVTFLTKHLSKYVIGSADMNEVTLTATTTLAASVSGGEIVLTATGSAFADPAAAASFTLSDSNLTVSAVKVSGATATLTVTGTPTAAGTLTVTAKKEAFDPAAAADANATVTVAEAAPAPTPTTVTLTATSTLAVGVNGGTITLTTDGAAFADPAVATNFTLSDTALTVTGVVVKDKTATLTVTGTPAESETLTVTVKKEAFAAAEADASVKLSVSLFTFDFTFETSMVEGKLVLTVGIEVYLRGNLLLTIPVEIPLS